MEQMNDCIKFVEKWSLRLTAMQKSFLIEYLNSEENHLGRCLMQKYIDLIKPYNEYIRSNSRYKDNDCLTSGLLFFYGCLVYLMHFSGWGFHIEDVFLYNILYVLVDHYIDDVKMDPITKQESINTMKLLIDNPNMHTKMDQLDPLLKVIATTYKKLIDHCPKAKIRMIDLFNAELEGLHIQHSAGLNEQTYYDISLKKGGKTMAVLLSIVNVDDEHLKNATYHLGKIMQLIDDSLDVFSDKANGIHTIATHHIDKYGNLDKLWMDIIYKINKIDSTFTIFKLIYTIIALYIPDRLDSAYSYKLRSSTNSMNIFDVQQGFDISNISNVILNSL